MQRRFIISIILLVGILSAQNSIVKQFSSVFADVAERLKRHGVDGGLLKELQGILDRCEAYHYGGVDENGGSQTSNEMMLDNALSVIKKIDLCFKK